MSLKQFLNRLECLSSELNSRYSECDSSGGHKSPDVKNNYCNHCYRHLEYKAPQTDKFIERSQNIPWYDQCHNGFALKKLGEVEIASQKSLDFFDGLSALEREEISKVKLENKF